MHLTLTSPSSTGLIRSIDLRSPGITIGSALENDWIPDVRAENLGSVQAVVRLQDDGLTLTNLGERLPVTVNGVVLPCHASLDLNTGDEISLGNCRLVVSSGTSLAQPTPATSSVNPVEWDPSKLGHETVAAGTIDANALPDPFADLLGPGTLPLGTPPDLNPAHPFDMESAGQRNAADPLAGWAQRPDTAPHARPQDPLALFDAAQQHDVPDVFTDHTPSVLDRPALGEDVLFDGPQRRP